MISFLPKTNAVQDVYAAKTDLMVPVGVDGGSEPTPTTTPFNVVSMTMYNEGGGAWSMELVSDQSVYGYEMVAEFYVGEDLAITGNFLSDANVTTLVGYDNDDLSVPDTALSQGGTWRATSLTYDGGEEIENTLQGTWTYVNSSRPTNY